MSVTHDSFRIERTYPATPERVFAAWTTLANKSQWFGEEGEGHVVEAHTLDFRVGGSEHLTLTFGTDTYRFDALYQDIVDNQRIVWSYDMHVGPRRMSVSLATVELTGVPGGTTLVMTEQGAFLDGLDTNDARRAGTEEFLGALGEFLAR